ncbi:hypothetical protein [uncultured Dubosiella sp.]|uniref:hypothetical protein n=1 Tax=uncultured Dubosiella sp. TaxID=1937011 RepID=UPI0020856C81|nr:hypothetical protein [uncultured Dubosiella sp.]GJM56670.1 hypothetical protein EROP_03630 [Erysipelotrichaceae bacterium OPF54]
MKPLIDYIKPHLLHSWEHAASFSHIRQRMTTPWQTCMLVWSLRRILVINMIIWLPVVVAYRYFVSLFISPIVRSGMIDMRNILFQKWKGRTSR